MRRSYLRRPNSQAHEKNEQPFFSKTEHLPVQAKEEHPPFFQPKGLAIGQPGDKYEQEADAIADTIVNQSSTSPAIHKKEISAIQRESLSTPQEDEKLSTAEQRTEEDKMVQEKPELPTEEEKKEEKKPVQTKSDTGTRSSGKSLINKIEHNTGKGKPLALKTKSEMETAFDANFSGVNIHTDEDAVKMNKNLHAQAFTHGKDIYFNSGKYNPETRAGKHLLTHELTHVVQQSCEN